MQRSGRAPPRRTPNVWNFGFLATDFRNANPPETVVTGSFTLMIDWAAPTTGLSNPRNVNVKIAGHTYGPNELRWSYLPATDKLILEPVDPLGDKEFLVTAGMDQMFLMVDRPRTTAPPGVFVYSVKGATAKWVATNVAVSASQCVSAFFKGGPIQRIRIPTYILCDIGKDLVRGRRPATLRNRSRRVLPAGTTLAYSTSDGAIETLRLQRDLRPGAAVLGPPTRSRSCRVEAVVPPRR